MSTNSWQPLYSPDEYEEIERLMEYGTPDMSGSCEDDEDEEGEIGYGPTRNKRQRIDSVQSSEASLSASPTPKDLFKGKFFTLHSVRASRLAKFALTDVVAEFSMTEMIDQPIEQLIEAIDKQIKMAIAETEKLNSGRKVEKFSLLLFGRGLDDPVVLPLRSFEQNSAEVLVNELEKLGQSEGEDNIDKRTLLISHPMKLIITCVTPPAGAGKAKGQIAFNLSTFDANEHFGYNNKQQIDVKWQTTEPYCLFYALVLGQRHREGKMVKELEKKKEPIPQGLMNRYAFRRFKENKHRVKKEALELMAAAKIPLGQKTYGIEHLAAVQHSLDEKFDGKFCIFAYQHQPEISVRPIWRNECIRPYNIYIFLKDNHWCAIKKISKFFPCMGRKWCDECATSYDRDVFHRVACKARCYYCGRVGFGHPCPITSELEFWEQCPKCKREFANKSCFEAHQLNEMCQYWRRCKACERVYLFDANDAHVCGSTYCQRCRVNHDKKRGCFVQKLKMKKRDYRIMVYDFETRQNQQIDDRTKLHVVNCVSVRITCTRCEDSGPNPNCQICGQKREFGWSEADGADCISAFTEWLLTAFDNKFDTLIWAHNAARFDSHFVFNYLMASGRRPDPSMIGLKIYEFNIRNSAKHSKLIFRDSYLLFSVPLADLPQTFDLQVQPKHFFPYLFNVPDNYGRRLDRLPPMEDYCPGSMTEAKFRAFREWYTAHAANTPFFLPDALKEYARNDTEILLQSILAFRQIFIKDVTGGMDPLPLSPTLAKLCLNIYTAMFMMPDSIAICPERGHERNDRASVLSICYLEYRAYRDGIRIQHAGNGYEFRYKGYKLDGWIPEQRKCIETMGCYYHGCLKCYSATDELVDKKLAMDLNEATRKRIANLKRPDVDGNTIEVEEIWECQIREELKMAEKLVALQTEEEVQQFEEGEGNQAELAKLEEAKKMREFFGDLGREKGPIDPRKAFHGGRCGPLALWAQTDDGMEISVFDIISLYPFINFSTSYPIGHPEIVVPDASQTHVNWTAAEHVPFKGLLKVRVIPPRGLALPVLPLKIDQRLLFGCCYKCARQFEKASTRVDHRCNHKDRERAFVSTVTHIELEEALKSGYRVDRFWRAWHYKQWSTSLFDGYVRHFLALKVQASGWPADCQTNEQKAQFVQMYEAIGVKIDPAKMIKNPGLRFISKICLNSLWGKFGQRNTLGKSQVIREPAEFFNLFYDHRQQINRIMRVSDEAIRVQTTTKTDFVTENPASNIVISLWTTSTARLVLLKFMQHVLNMPGATLLYTDTDSIIVRHVKGIDPLPTGTMLGAMQREYVAWEILEYCSGGAKQYGLRMRSRATGEEKHILRLRGITLDQHNASRLSYDKFCQMVINFPESMASYFSYQSIQARANSTVITREYCKKYMPVLQKGIVTEDLKVLPFGYHRNGGNFIDQTEAIEILPMALEITPTEEDINAVPQALRHRIAVFLDLLATIELCCDLNVPYCLNLRRQIVIRHGHLQNSLAALNLDWAHPIRVHLRRIHLHFHRRVVQIGRMHRQQQMMRGIVEGNGEEEEE